MPKLNALSIKKLSRPGMHADGAGLYLYVGSGGAKSWIFRYSLHARRREMGLGSLEVVPLSAAREQALECRRLILAGRDPISARETDRAAQARVQAKARTLLEVAEEYVAAHGAQWTERQRLDWRNSLVNHTRDLVGRPVDEIERDDVVAELRRIWSSKAVTAHRLQERLERLFGYAKVMGYRKTENPATWKANLQHVLPPKTRTKGHFVAMNREELPGFIARLEQLEGAAFRALQFIILNATRTMEALAAEWAEFDLDRGLWTIPGPRMKSGRTHVVPLSRQSVAILRQLFAVRQSQYVFPSRIYGRHLSQMACLVVMRRLGREEDVHGFRSTFKDWARDCTAERYPDDLSEFALAHQISDRVKAAYMRTTMIERRRELMQEWADFCSNEKK